MKFIVTKKGESESEYMVINKTTAEQLVKKGIIRARKERGSPSIISEPVHEIKELPGSLDLFYSMDDYDELADPDSVMTLIHLKDNKI